MTDTSKSPPGFGQYVLAIILGLLAIAAGGISLGMNVAFGLKTGLVMAAIFALSDCAKIILPMIDAAIGGSSAKRRLAKYVAVAISLIAATSYLLETQATRLIQSQVRTAAIADARTDVDRLRAELSTISEKRSPEAINAEIEAHKQHKRWASTIECTDATVQESRLYCRAYNQLKADLATAERRNQLEARLAGLKAAITDVPEEALGASNTLAGLTGGDVDQIATHEALVKAILMLIILEIIAMFSGDAGSLFVRTYQMRKAHRQPVQQGPEADETELKTDEISPKKPAASYWMQRLSKVRPDLAAQVIAGEISCYRGCIKAGIRKQPAKKWTKAEDYLQPVEA